MLKADGLYYFKEKKVFVHSLLWISSFLISLCDISLYYVDLLLLLLSVIYLSQSKTPLETLAWEKIQSVESIGTDQEGAFEVREIHAYLHTPHFQLISNQNHSLLLT
jgi:hypothetical protein